jgi:hypothetical protein
VKENTGKSLKKVKEESPVSDKSDKDDNNKVPPGGKLKYDKKLQK